MFFNCFESTFTFHLFLLLLESFNRFYPGSITNEKYAENMGCMYISSFISYS